MRSVGGGILAIGPSFGAACPAGLKSGPGKSCCLDKSKRPPGAPKKDQCCGPKTTPRIIQQKGGLSLSCKAAPGGGTPGTGPGKGKSSGTFKVIAVSGGSLTADRAVSWDCKSGQTPELRRAGAEGMQEFGGDVIGSPSGNVIQFSPGPAPPQVGDTFAVYCANVGSGDSASGGGVFESMGVLPGSLSTWLIGGAIIGGGYLLYKRMKQSQVPYAPTRRYR